MKKLFSSNLITPGILFASALRAKTEDLQQQPRTHEVADPDKMEPRVHATLVQHERQKRSQSARGPNVNNLSLDKMLNVVVNVVSR
jgi:hypothetical protein